LLALVAIGLDAIVRPRRHLNKYRRRGGEMLREWDELQVQLGGLLFSCGSGWVLYQIAPSVWRMWFR
jgi:hypothetical protein